MATWREVSYAIADFSKSISDDSIINIDHIVFLMSKYRNYILNANFSSLKRAIGDSNYQTICVDLERAYPNLDFCGKEEMLVSKQPVPFTLTIGYKSIFPFAGFNYGRINFVNNTKFKYSGHNKFLRREIYATIGPDGKMYLKSNDPNFMNLCKVGMTALFSEPEKAALMECSGPDGCADNCELMDKHFPLDDSYLPTLMQVVVRDITGAMWKPGDSRNDATDNLADFAQVLNRFTTQAFKNMMNANDGNSNQQV